MVQPTKRPMSADSAIGMPAGIHARRVSGAISYGFFFFTIVFAVLSTTASRYPISRPAPLIDSMSAGMSIPDSQTTEHAPQVVQL